MGYVELVWIKVRPLSPPTRRTTTAGCTSSSTRTGSARVVGDPKRANARPRSSARPHVRRRGHAPQKSFYFPYKHSVMTMTLRERLFKEDVFH
ncbi:hypothetical protein DFH11DRAFT_1644972 [Phellopilus nigrolimitatus]|nr:hypothetical protein DFH11DRAFT_1644972 [Phellopilus nigrolimitatus]